LCAGEAGRACERERKAGWPAARSSPSLCCGAPSRARAPGQHARAAQARHQVGVAARRLAGLHRKQAAAGAGAAAAGYEPDEVVQRDALAAVAAQAAAAAFRHLNLYRDAGSVAVAVAAGEPPQLLLLVVAPAVARHAPPRRR
jgi:hypothetical protein